MGQFTSKLAVWGRSVAVEGPVLRPNILALNPSFQGDGAAPVGSNGFSLVGIPLWFMLRFIQEHGGRAAFKGKTTTQVNEMFVQPETAGIKASYVKLLRRSGRADSTGTATWFISHAWKCNFLDVCDAALAFFVRECGSKEAAGKVVIWFDLFSNSQHDTSAKAFEWWTGTFMNAIQTMGNVLMIMTPWDNPIPLTRAWCVFELYAATKTKSRFEVGMTAKENAKFLKEIRRDPSKYYKMLGTINSSKATAFKDEDRDAIFEAIRREVGFTEMDSQLLRVLEEWMARELRKQVEAERGRGNEEAAGVWLYTLGRFYVDGGKYDLALPCYEESLDIDKRVLGEDHPNTLASVGNLALLYEKQGNYDAALSLNLECLDKLKRTLGEDHLNTLNAISNLAVLYENQGNYGAALPLKLECLDKCKRILGEDHPETLTSMNNLGCCYRDMGGRLEEARAMLEECVKATKRVEGPEHPVTLRFSDNLAFIVLKQGFAAEAAARFAALLGTMERILGVDHDFTKRVRERLALAQS